MVEVYLDSGRVVIPDMIRLPVLPLAVRQPVSLALARILHPDFDTRDLVFGEKDFRTKSLATQVRAEKQLGYVHVPSGASLLLPL